MGQKLGQHFLINPSVLARIADAIHPHTNETIIEVGPGHGELTDALLALNPHIRLILIEKDAHLAKNLRDKYSTTSIEIITGDVLTLLPSLLHPAPDTPHSVKVVGNIPYYLTGFLLHRLLELEEPPHTIVFTIQKEVAERIVAHAPHMNLLAASVQYFGTPELLFTISRQDFNPPPQVDSATIRITLRTPISTREERAIFFRVVKAGFSHPRKLLMSNLIAAFAVPKSTLENIFTRLAIRHDARGQHLDIATWSALSRDLQDSYPTLFALPKS
ncbi:MAG: ribosomal RNA small subunit methyltransferase A [Patescibacteria group bacterium]|nr:ribosomal RNA small subunit methyltransferase A [Patescibacteria group bacterium]MDE2438517.1 ribosomal RNA small subunit methyltransferase A [Patescibacteria group bacterium]